MISIGLSIFCSVLSVVAGIVLTFFYFKKMKKQKEIEPLEEFEAFRATLLEHNRQLTLRLEEIQKRFPIGNAVTLVREEQNNMREILNQVIQYLISLEEGSSNGS